MQLNLLEGLDSLLNYFVPALFQVGHCVRSCTWEGRTPKSGSRAKEILQDCLILLHMLLGMDKNALFVACVHELCAVWVIVFVELSHIESVS